MLAPWSASLQGGVSALGDENSHRLNPSVVSTKWYTVPMYPWLKARATDLIGSGNDLLSIFPWFLGAVCVWRGVLPERQHSTVP